MYRKLAFILCLVLCFAAVVCAEERKAVSNGAVTPAGSNAANGPSAAGGPSAARAAGGTTPARAASPAGAAETSGNAALPGNVDPEAKLVKGMAVLGNNEAPMSLFIVPWKSSELGVETSLTRTLDERDVPVDRDVFRREIDFYQVSVSGKTVPTAVSSLAK